MILFLLVFVLAGAGGYSQVSLRGVIENQDGGGVNGATIELYGSRSTQSAPADMKGSFLFSGLAANQKYLLQVSAVGFEPQSIPFFLQNDTTLHIILKETAVSLEGVSVVAKAKLMDIRPDKTVVNLSADPVLANGNISDLLGRLPGVQMNGDVVSLPGRGEVRLMQDGRLLQLSGKDLTNYLRTIPANNVSKIEIITNPPASFDAEGDAGVINIITKRNRQSGYSGSVQTGFQQWYQYPGMDAAGNLNYNKGKWNVFANAGMFRIRREFGYRWEEYYPDRSWIMSDTGDYKLQNLSFNAGADFRVSPRATLGVQAGYTRYYEGGADHVRNHFYNSAGKVDSLLTTHATYVPLAKTQSYDLYYKRLLDTSGAQLSVEASYLDFYRVDTSEVLAKTFLPDGSPVDGSTGRYYNNAVQHINIYTLQADVQLPATWAAWQFGGKANFISTLDGLQYYQVEGSNLVYDEGLSSRYRYTENTQALYANAGKTLGKWMIEMGMRGELTQTTGNSLLTHQKNTNEYFRLFPNLLVNYRRNESNSLAFSFNKRISRPTFWNLNPYKTILTSYSFAEGNPLLQPEYNSNFQIAHTYKSKLTSALFVTLTNNSFSEITIADIATNIVMRKPFNYANSVRIGLSESYRLMVLHWWESNNMATAYYTDGKSKLDFIMGRKGWGAYVFTNNQFYLNSTKTVSASVNFWYQFPEVVQVNSGFAYSNLDLGVSAKLMDDKFTLNASLRDVFGSSASSYANNVNHIYQKYAVLQLNRHLSLSLTFKFGKQRTSAPERIESNQSDRDRM